MGIPKTGPAFPGLEARAERNRAALAKDAARRVYIQRRMLAELRGHMVGLIWDDLRPWEHDDDMTVREARRWLHLLKIANGSPKAVRSYGFPFITFRRDIIHARAILARFVAIFEED